MNHVGSDTAQWHLEQAAICEMAATRHARRGMYHDADRARNKADEHREKAAELERRTAA